MLYVIAFFCPPLAVIMCGRTGKALLAFLLWLLFWIPGVIYAFVVISDCKAKKRDDRLMQAISARK